LIVGDASDVVAYPLPNRKARSQSLVRMMLECGLLTPEEAAHHHYRKELLRIN